MLSRRGWILVLVLAAAAAAAALACSVTIESGGELEGHYRRGLDPPAATATPTTAKG